MCVREDSLCAVACDVTGEAGYDARPPPRAFPLPKGWGKRVKSSLLHAISLAAMALTVARSRAAGSRGKTHRLQAELDRSGTNTLERGLLSGLSA
jgi:hypothetical protein